MWLFILTMFNAILMTGLARSNLQSLKVFYSSKKIASNDDDECPRADHSSAELDLRLSNVINKRVFMNN